MKRKSKYLVLLLLLLVVCSGLVTYAIYKTNKSGNATVNAARWNVVFKNGEEVISNNFDISLEDAEWTNELGRVASGKIAPGSTATFYITIDATNTETSVDYTAEIDESFDESDFEVTLAQDSGTIPYSTVENAMVRQIPIRVVWNGNINDDDNKNSDDLLKRARDITIPIKLTAAQKLALKYTVTFNDGAGNTISTKKVDEGSTVGTLPANPTRIGYTFAGWYDDPTNGNQVTAETLATSGMNIYAHWNIKNVTVTFNSNGGSSVASQTVQEGSTINPLPTSTKTNYVLDGWYNGNNKLTTSTQIMENITYTARWKEPLAGTLVYYDPVSTSPCDETHTSSSTCYRWRVIDTDDTKENINIMKESDLFVSVWNSDGDITHGPVTILNQLASATSSWTRVPLLNYTYDSTVNSSTYNYGTLSCTNGTCTIGSTGTSISNLRARLATSQELSPINTSQTMYYPSWLGTNNYEIWLLSTNNNGQPETIYSNGSASWISNDSILDNNHIRPVITVPKADLNLN